MSDTRGLTDKTAKRYLLRHRAKKETSTEDRYRDGVYTYGKNYHKSYLVHDAASAVKFQCYVLS